MRKPDIKLEMNFMIGEVQGAIGTTFLLFFLPSSVASFSPSFHKYLVSTYYVPGLVSVLGIKQ